jgi:6,7-dimethyl-8-ribityllumazine synthase
MTASNGPRVFAGDQSCPLGTRVAIVVSRWNEQVTRRLLDGAVGRLAAAGIAGTAVDVAWVPGAFELPAAADRLAATGRYAAVLCLGAIIKGETEHDRVIAHAVARGIEETARHRGLPVLFGVLTCDNLAQALARAAAVSFERVSSDKNTVPADNKGAECAAAALAMIALFTEVPVPSAAAPAGGR